jgi:hypothetical protein
MAAPKKSPTPVQFGAPSPGLRKAPNSGRHPFEATVAEDPAVVGGDESPEPALAPEPPIEPASVPVREARAEKEALLAFGTKLPVSLHRRLKIAAVSSGVTVQEAVIEAVGQWLDTQNR